MPAGKRVQVVGVYRLSAAVTLLDTDQPLAFAETLALCGGAAVEYLNTSSHSGRHDQTSRVVPPFGD
jgi:hypothetical protein